MYGIDPIALSCYRLFCISESLVSTNCLNEYFAFLRPGFIVGIFVAAIIILFVISSQSTPSQSMLPNNLQSAGYFLSAATSLTATVLIGSRVNSVAKDGTSDSSGRFKNILEIMIQSVAIYSLAIILQAISVVIPNDGSSPELTALQNYSSAILTPIAVRCLSNMTIILR